MYRYHMSNCFDPFFDSSIIIGSRVDFMILFINVYSSHNYNDLFVIFEEVNKLSWPDIL
jgi:hypothetical protein